MSGLEQHRADRTIKRRTWRAVKGREGRVRYWQWWRETDGERETAKERVCVRKRV